MRFRGILVSIFAGSRYLGLPRPQRCKYAVAVSLHGGLLPAVSPIVSHPLCDVALGERCAPHISSPMTRIPLSRLGSKGWLSISRWAGDSNVTSDPIGGASFVAKLRVFESISVTINRNVANPSHSGSFVATLSIPESALAAANCSHRQNHSALKLYFNVYYRSTYRINHSALKLYFDVYYMSTHYTNHIIATPYFICTSC